MDIVGKEVAERLRNHWNVPPQLLVPVKIPLDKVIKSLQSKKTQLQVIFIYVYLNFFMAAYFCHHNYKYCILISNYFDLILY